MKLPVAFRNCERAYKKSCFHRRMEPRQTFNLQNHQYKAPQRYTTKTWLIERYFVSTVDEQLGQIKSPRKWAFGGIR